MRHGNPFALAQTKPQLAKGSKGSALMRAFASHQCGPGSNPSVNAICGLSLLLVLSLAALWVSRFSAVLKRPFYISKFQFDKKSG